MIQQMRCRVSFLVPALLALGGPDLAGQVLDRSVRPPAAAQPPFQLPRIETRTLPNKTGLGRLTQAMLSEGTTQRTADQIADAAAALGGTVGSTYLFTLTNNLDSALALVADQLLNPAFPQGALDRLKANTIAGLRREK